MKKEEFAIPKEIEIMLHSQRWCHNNDIEHYVKEGFRLFIVIRKNNKVYELELSQEETELRAKEYKNNLK
jgi:hypothetical protein|tara:strand:+ start:42 stop:251 length:210 start_codon:yes stop_codon:yes gene_type:complete